MNSNKDILLVEDDDVEVLKLKRIFRKLEIKNSLVHKVNGKEALEYLNNSKDNLPGLVLLDLNMPVMNGFSFLEYVKKNMVFKMLPIVVLTTSNEFSDKEECYKLDVSGYIIKPSNLKEYRSMICNLKNYWGMIELPY